MSVSRSSAWSCSRRRPPQTDHEAALYVAATGPAGRQSTKSAGLEPETAADPKIESAYINLATLDGRNADRRRPGAQKHPGAEHRRNHVGHVHAHVSAGGAAAELVDGDAR